MTSSSSKDWKPPQPAVPPPKYAQPIPDQPWGPHPPSGPPPGLEGLPLTDIPVQGEPEFEPPDWNEEEITGGDPRTYLAGSDPSGQNSDQLNILAGSDPSGENCDPQAILAGSDPLGVECDLMTLKENLHVLQRYRQFNLTKRESQGRYQRRGYYEEVG